MDVARRFDVDRERVGARLGVLGCEALRLLDHHVHGQRTTTVVDVVGERRDNLVTKGDDRNEVPVHHVNVERACTRVHQVADLCAERAKIGRQDRRADLHLCDPRIASTHTRIMAGQPLGRGGEARRDESFACTFVGPQGEHLVDRIAIGRIGLDRA